MYNKRENAWSFILVLALFYGALLFALWITEN